jgi:RND family efflux transporter MFP subunit
LVAQAQAATGSEGLEFIGELRARDEAPVAFRVGGRIVERRVRIGSSVKAGEVLARLDPADLDRAAQIDEANLLAAQSHQAWAEQQLVRARAEEGRGLASRAELEQAQDAAAAAQAALDAAQARRALSQQQRSYATLVAEYDAVVTQELAQLDQVVAPGQGIYQLARVGAREVVFDVPLSLAHRVRRGQAVVFRSADLPGLSFAARVTEVAESADPVARSRTVQAMLDDSNRALTLGMTVTVLVLNEPMQGSQTWVPAGAIFHDGERPAVWVVDRQAGRLTLQDVTLEGYVGRRAKVGGLRAGQWVAAAGVHTLDAQTAVTPVEPIRPEDGQP